MIALPPGYEVEVSDIRQRFNQNDLDNGTYLVVAIKEVVDRGDSYFVALVVLPDAPHWLRLGDFRHMGARGYEARLQLAP